MHELSVQSIAARRTARTHAWRIGTFALLGAPLLGCTDPISSNRTESEARRLAQVASGEASACVLVPVSGSSTHALVITGDALPMRLPSLQMATRDTVSSRRFLRVASARISGRSEQSLAVACLVPSSVSDRQLGHLARASAGSLVSRYFERAGTSISLVSEADGPMVSSSAPDLLAGRLLLDLARGLVPGTSVSVEHARPSEAAGNTAGYWGGYQLPTVTITATAGSLISHSSAIYWTLHEFSRWSPAGLTVIEEYPPGFCASQSERWIVLNEEINRLRDDSIAIAEAMAGRTEPFGERCEFQSGNKRVCVDFFIMSSWEFIFKGDGRTFDANAPYAASRAQLYLDFDSLTVRAYYGNSSVGMPAFPANPTPGTPPGNFIDFPGVEWEVAPYVHQPKDIRLEALPLGRVKLTVELYNGFCTWVGRALCPSIDAEVVFFKNGSGQWTTNAETVIRDRFPSLGVYRDNGNGTWSTVYEDPEGSFWHLVGVAHMKEELERERDETLGGCELQ